MNLGTTKVSEKIIFLEVLKNGLYKVYFGDNVLGEYTLRKVMQAFPENQYVWKYLNDSGKDHIRK